ncbi:hypothetical protein AB0N61_15790 [Microbacterium sp. NPDC089320]|uniref:hypothetical protein n=1 Tax=Microbacterium sp. NPDC089320 TaxID=3155182 RepID=UPI003447222C
MTIRILLLALAAAVGVALSWWGAAALFAAGVQADRDGTAGGLDALPLAAAIVGVVCVVWALCAGAWQVGLARERRRYASAPQFTEA